MCMCVCWVTTGPWSYGEEHKKLEERTLFHVGDTGRGAMGESGHWQLKWQGPGEGRGLLQIGKLYRTIE